MIEPKTVDNTKGFLKKLLAQKLITQASNSSIFEVNDSASLTVKYIGNENNCILIFDQFLKFPGRVRDYAINQAQFKSSPKGKYPGIRHRLHQEETDTIIDGLQKAVLEHIKIKIDADCTGNGYFSLVTLKPEELTFEQTIPHFDAVVPDKKVAVVHYLSLPEMCWGGTAFYRHKATGFESISVSRLADYNESQAKFHHHYVTDSNDDFELLELIPMKYNRLVAYSSNLLHSGYIKPDMLSSEPSKGRLTVNLFIQDKIKVENEDKLDTIELDTILRKRDGITAGSCRVIYQEDWQDMVGIIFPEKQVWGPKKIEPSLRFVIDNNQFAVKSFPGTLSDKAKLVLARRLVKEGLLTIVDDGKTG
ncbi:MAG: hypothetical protein F6K55_23100 [Moorea sp. SIO4A3]|nr:hypothetical protein [Moorena sp. SIO4A3]